MNGCQVTFVYATSIDFEEETHFRYQVNLGDLDPTSIEASDPSHRDFEPVSLVMVYTTDKVPTIRLNNEDRIWNPAIPTLPSTDMGWELPAPYAARFAKAFKQAIALCGGKSSSF